MNNFCRSLFISGILVSSSFSVSALNRNEIRQIKSIEVVVPHGTWALDEFFKELQLLNPKINVIWPTSADHREFSYFKGSHEKNSTVSLDVLAGDFAYNIKTFDQLFAWDVNLDRVELKPKTLTVTPPSTTRILSKMAMPEWAKSLPSKSSAVTVMKGESVNIESGYYHEPVTVDGDLTLVGDKFAFNQLQVSGNLNLQNQSIAGDNMELSGTVTLGKNSHAQFETVTTKGQLDLKPGSSLTVKDIILGEHGDIILNENSDLIFN